MRFLAGVRLDLAFGCHARKPIVAKDFLNLEDEIQPGLA
jgi:hypothetical protein